MKHRSLRAIDQGTVYDLRGQLLRESRTMPEDVSDIVMVERHRGGKITTYHWGAGTRETAHFMVSTAKNRLEPV